MRMNDLLEEDLKILKETDFMGPTTRAEFNRRKQVADGPRASEVRSLVKTSPPKIDDIRKKPKSEQLDIMRQMFG